AQLPQQVERRGPLVDVDGWTKLDDLFPDERTQPNSLGDLRRAVGYEPIVGRRDEAIVNAERPAFVFDDRAGVSTRERAALRRRGSERVGELRDVITRLR